MSQYYLGVDRSKQIRHWKYIKRERVNGKWRYYYDDYAARNDFNEKMGYNAKQNLENAKFKKNLFEGQSYRHRKEYEHAKLEYGRDGKIDKYERIILAKAAHKSAESSATAAKVGREYIKAKEAYMKTPLGKAEKFIKTASKFLKKLFGVK